MYVKVPLENSEGRSSLELWRHTETVSIAGLYCQVPEHTQPWWQSKPALLISKCPFQSVHQLHWELWTQALFMVQGHTHHPLWKHLWDTVGFGVVQAAQAKHVRVDSWFSFDMGTTSKFFLVELLVRWGMILGNGTASKIIFLLSKRQIQARQKLQSSQAWCLQRWGSGDAIVELGVLAYIGLLCEF